MITYIPGWTKVRCDGGCNYAAVFAGKLTAGKAAARVRKQGWKVTDTGHLCGRCWVGHHGDGKAAL